MLFSDRADGAISSDNQIFGSYLHGIFEKNEACAALLDWAGLEKAVMPDYRQLKEDALDRLADSIENHIDMEKVFTQ